MIKYIVTTKHIGDKDRTDMEHPIGCTLNSWTVVQNHAGCWHIIAMWEYDSDGWRRGDK